MSEPYARIKQRIFWSIIVLLLLISSVLATTLITRYREQREMLPLILIQVGQLTQEQQNQARTISDIQIKMNTLTPPPEEDPKFNTLYPLIMLANTLAFDNPALSITLLNDARAQSNSATINESIAHDLILLNTAQNTMNITVNQLNELSSRLATITTEPVKNLSTTTPLPTAPKETPAWWKRYLQEGLQKIKSTVFLRNNPEPAQASTSASELQFVHNQFTVLIAQAQWALLNHQASTYQANLNNAQQLLNQYFINNPVDLEAATQLITTLLAQPVNTRLSLRSPQTIQELINHPHATEEKKPA